MFPVDSTSTETQRIARAIRVFQRHAKAAALVTSAGVFNCKQTVGTVLYSAHAFGDAVDLMNGKPDELARIAEIVIRDATRRTWRNRLRPTEVVYVIWGTRQWVKDHGESAYEGVAHTNHVHVGCSFSTRAIPACDGGRNYRVRYVHGPSGLNA